MRLVPERPRQEAVAEAEAGTEDCRAVLCPEGGRMVDPLAAVRTAA